VNTVSPPHDVQNMTAFLAAQVIYESLVQPRAGSLGRDLGLEARADLQSSWRMKSRSLPQWGPRG
jgi:hypothetical protein